MTEADLVTLMDKNGIGVAEFAVGIPLELTTAFRHRRDDRPAHCDDH
jgi:hypothetical protein